jgi:hypothetical protein
MELPTYSGYGLVSRKKWIQAMIGSVLSIAQVSLLTYIFHRAVFRAERSTVQPPSRTSVTGGSLVRFEKI